MLNRGAGELKLRLKPLELPAFIQLMYNSRNSGGGKPFAFSMISVALRPTVAAFTKMRHLV